MTNVLANQSPAATCGPGPEVLLRELAPADAERVRHLELWRQGATATGCLVVAAGTAEVHRGGRRAGRLEPGAIAGVAPLLARHPHTTSVVAATPLTFWWIGAEALDHLVFEAPTFAGALVRRLARASVAASF